MTTIGMEAATENHETNGHATSARRLDAADVKGAAAGRWPEILATIGGIDPAILDGNHHPCPKCSGTDRFRMVDKAAGAVLCNQCFNTANGDGLSAIQWLTGCAFPEALDRVADYLGLLHTNSVGQCENATSKALDPLAAIASVKGVARQLFIDFGAIVFTPNSIWFPQFGPDGKQCSGFRIWLNGTEAQRKGKNDKGKSAGLFFTNQDDVARLPQPGETWHVVEGVKDSSALHGLKLLACGLPTSGMKANFARLFKGAKVILIPDRDSSGENGARKSARVLRGIAESVSIATLPAEFKESNGADVRDIIRQQGESAVFQAIADAKLADEVKIEQHGGKPEVELPNGVQTNSDAGNELGRLLAAKRMYYLRGGVVTRIADDGTLAVVRAVEAASDFERVAKLYRIVGSGKKIEEKPATCSESTARIIIASHAFTSILPRLNLTARCPVLIERHGQLAEVAGYDSESGVLASGKPTISIASADATKILIDILADFQFATPADRSRALAAMITPALVMGNLLPGRAPIDLSEADKSQTGKGYWNRLKAAIYRCSPRPVTQRKSGVGSLEESFDRALIEGETFISLDNIRGVIDSPAIESFCTEDWYTARSAYSPPTKIDPRRVCLMFTSNRADVTKDLANRSSCVRLLKKSEAYQFRIYSEGDVLTHVQANQPQYLGAVFAVIRAWYSAGKPRTNETRHDFRAWVQILDWIVQNIFHATPLMDGHRETQQRMTNPAMNWLRDVMLAVFRSGRIDVFLKAHELLEIIDADGAVEVPSLKVDENLDDEAVNKRVLQQIGKKLKRCFVDTDSLTIDQSSATREGYTDDSSRLRHLYKFSRVVPERIPDRFSPDEFSTSFSDMCQQATDGIKDNQTNQGITGQDGRSPDGSPDRPLMVPLINTRGSPDSPDGCLDKLQSGNVETINPNINALRGHQGITGNQGTIKGECQHNFVVKPDRHGRQGWTETSCEHCGKIYGYTGLGK